MNNNGKVLVIVAVAVGLYFVSDKIRRLFNSAKDSVLSIVPTPIQNVVTGGNPHSGKDYDKLHLYCSMQGRDNVYSSPVVARGEIIFDQMLELDAKLTAGAIVASNTRFVDNDVIDNFLAWGIELTGATIDTPNTVLEIFLSFENAIHLAQVAYWYNLATGKNLADGIQWLPSTMVQQIYDKVNWFDNHIGATWAATGKPLSYAEFRDLMKGKFKN